MNRDMNIRVTRHTSSHHVKLSKLHIHRRTDVPCFLCTQKLDKKGQKSEGNCLEKGRGLVEGGREIGRVMGVNFFKVHV